MLTAAEEAEEAEEVEEEEEAEEAGAASANHATAPLLHPHMHGVCKATAPASGSSGKRTAALLASGTAWCDERHVGAARASGTASATDETHRHSVLLRDILHTHTRAHARDHARAQCTHIVRA